MDLIIARLERLERDSRRSRLRNRVALLALLVAVCAGFAQQQDPKLPDVIKCKRVEADTAQLGALHVLRGIIGGESADDWRFVLEARPDGGVVQLRGTDGLHRYMASAVAGSAGFEATQYAKRWDLLSIDELGNATVRQVRGAVFEKGDWSRLAIIRDGRERAVLGTMDSRDKLERDTHYPESTLTLIDKDGRFLEQLPR